MLPYQKGPHYTHKVLSVHPKMDESSGQQKLFKRQNGEIRYVFEVIFENGYRAEFVSVKKEQTSFIPGVSTEFKLINKNQFGDTIEAVHSVDNEQDIKRSAYMSGHAAVFAMGFAKDLSTPLELKNTGDVIACADTIYEWLMDKKDSD